MIKMNFSGRTGNILLQNIGISIIVSKFNLSVKEFLYIPDSENIGLRLYSGERIEEEILQFTDYQFRIIRKRRSKLWNRIYWIFSRKKFY
jgi:hypothetical protein